jgi:Family of unknown function (DUF6492)
MRVDFLTVVFADEIPYIQTQAESMDRYVPADSESIFYVIVNDHDRVADLIDKNWWGVHSANVRIVCRSFWNCEINLESEGWGGWYSQQVLKLRGTALSDSKWCLVLDAKTWFVKDFVKETYYDTEGRVFVQPSQPIKPCFRDAGDILSLSLGMPVNTVIFPGGVPFWFHTKTVKELFIQFESIFMSPYQMFWYVNRRFITEFILYSAFVQYMYDGVDKLYHESNSTYLCSYNMCHSSDGVFNPSFIKTLNPSTISIHRKIVPQMSESDLNQVIFFMRERGLTFRPPTGIHTSV